MAAAPRDQTGLWEIRADHLNGFRLGRQVRPAPREVIYGMFGRAHSIGYDPASAGITSATEAVPGFEPNLVGPAVDTTVELARCFLRLANLPNVALDRLSRYEAILWRPSRPDNIRARCLGSPQTAREKTNTRAIIVATCVEALAMNKLLTSLCQRNGERESRVSCYAFGAVLPAA